MRFMALCPKLSRRLQSKRRLGDFWRKRLRSCVSGLLAAACVAAVAAGGPRPHFPDGWEVPRQVLLDELRRQGIADTAVLKAMAAVPRHEFVPMEFRKDSYLNQPLPIGFGQTISQPFIVAYMCQELHLKPTDRILEIGTGSGYHAAVLSLLGREVWTIEIIPELAERARRTLQELNYSNVHTRVGDGYQGWPEAAPFDAVVLTAAPREIPKPLLDQLAPGGRLIAPVGEGWQELVLVKRTASGLEQRTLLPVRFVPMTGQAEEH